MNERKPFWWLVAIGQAIAWSVGLIVALSIALSVAGFLLSRYGTDRYVLECPGLVSQKGNSSYQASLFLDVTEYGSIIQLWSDGMGSAQVEIPKDFYAFTTLTKAGTQISLSSFGSYPGNYSPISQTISMKMDNGRYFDGKCLRRKD